MDRPPWAPAEVDVTRPTAARDHDCYLEGSPDLGSDREPAQEALHGGRPS